MVRIFFTVSKTVFMMMMMKMMMIMTTTTMKLTPTKKTLKKKTTISKNKNCNSAIMRTNSQISGLLYAGFGLLMYTHLFDILSSNTKFTQE